MKKLWERLPGLWFFGGLAGIVVAAWVPSLWPLGLIWASWLVWYLVVSFASKRPQTGHSEGSARDVADDDDGS